MLYGLVAYLSFFVVILYSIGFLGNVLVPKSVDGPATVPVVEAILINGGILALFAIQHTIMARKWFKDWITKIIPPAAERSTFVLFASLILAALYWKWEPIEGTIWSLDGIWATLMLVLFWVGWGILFLSSFLINHFDLFGLRQVYLNLTKKEYTGPEFRVPSLYKMVRHPLYFGLILGMWATPVMSAGHLFFAVMATGYIFVGVRFEERDLIRIHGQNYLKYQKEVPMIIPLPKSGKGGERTPEPRPSEG
jgi:protein-S-isoprenylcysteine O-methyltransferase Ste14